MNVGAVWYILLITIAGQPSTTYDWRIDGGWDSCLLMERMVRSYASMKLETECLSAKDWEARGRPGSPERRAPHRLGDRR